MTLIDEVPSDFEEKWLNQMDVEHVKVQETMQEKVDELHMLVPTDERLGL